MRNCDDFVSLLTGASSGVQAKHEEVIEWWGEGDAPPIMVLLMFLGSRIAEDFRHAGDDVNRRLFSVIEQGMESCDKVLGDAVAMGLIEALITAADERPGLWTEMVPFLGPQSRDYAEAWLRFCALNFGADPPK